MAAITVNRELNAIRKRTIRLAVISAAVHLVAGYLIMSMEPALPVDPLADYLITEITWVVPTPVTVAAAAIEKPAESNIQPTVAATVKTKPEPLAAPGESARAIGNHLAAQRVGRPAGRPVAEAATADLSLRRNSVLATFASGAGRPAADLKRDHGEGLTQIAADPRPIRREAATVAAIATAKAGADETPRLSPDLGKELSQDISQEISPGVSLAGPVTGRTLLSYDTPAYPEWARQDGVEVTVKLYFTVLPSGKVKENVRIERTSGYRDFDQRAKSSLQSWLFETLGEGATAEQWGRIEFNYRLKQAG